MSVTFGVEEEFHVVDLETRRLVPRGPELLELLPDEGFTKELHQTVVETNTRPHRTLTGLRQDLLTLRGQLAEAGDALGLAAVAAGTVPLAGVNAYSTTHDERYEHMASRYQQLVREQLICSTQVHVYVPDRDLAVAALPWISPWLPTFLAMSASSPMWLGTDTGFASWRTMLWQRWPTAGPVGEFRSSKEYDEAIDTLVRSGVISDPGMIYTDVRLSHHVPTLELRVCDSCADVDDILVIAALFRALVLRACDAVRAGRTAPTVRQEWIRAASWQAARWGLEGDLLDPASMTTVPAAEVVQGLLEELRPTLEGYGEWEAASGLASGLLERGSSSARQRAAASSSAAWSPAAAVDLLVEETRQVRPWQYGPTSRPIPQQSSVAQAVLREHAEGAA